MKGAGTSRRGRVFAFAVRTWVRIRVWASNMLLVSVTFIQFHFLYLVFRNNNNIFTARDV